MEKRFIPKIENDVKKHSKKTSRREFLKTTGMIGAGIIGGVKMVDILVSDFKSEVDDARHKSEEYNFTPTEEQISIREVDEESVENIVNYDKKEIDINPNNIEKIKLYWENKYKDNPSYRHSFESAYYKMGAWKDLLKNAFEEELNGVLSKDTIDNLIYLAIPESHWKLKAVSTKGAVGSYQIIRSTARKYGMKIGKDIDERIDPVLSAKACARIIKDLLRDFNGNFDLAISGYNGSFVYNYKRHNRSKDLSYSGFLKYIEDKVNDLKDKLETEKFYTYTVGHHDTLYKISRASGVSIEEILFANKIKDASKIYYNQKIKLPLSGDVKKKIFNRKTRGIKENIVYPAKYKAIRDLINDGYGKNQEKELVFSVIEVEGFVHKMRKGDTLYSLSKKYNLDIKDIISANKHISPTSIPLGYNLNIPMHSTLEKISKEKRVSISRLRDLNPAIKNIYAKLPIGFKVRV